MNSQTLYNKEDNTTKTQLLLLLSSMASRIMQEIPSLVLEARLILSKICRVEVYKTAERCSIKDSTSDSMVRDKVARASNGMRGKVAREQVVAMEPLHSN